MGVMYIPTVPPIVELGALELVYQHMYLIYDGVILLGDIDIDLLKLEQPTSRKYYKVH